MTNEQKKKRKAEIEKKFREVVARYNSFEKCIEDFVGCGKPTKKK